MDIFRHHNSLEAAQNRVNHREKRQDDDGPNHGNSEEAFKHFGRCEKTDANVDEQRTEQSDHRHEGPRRRAVAALEEFG